MNVRVSPVRMEAGVKTAGRPTPATVLRRSQGNFLGEEVTVMWNSTAVWNTNVRTEPPATHGWRVENTVTHACALMVSMMSTAPQEQRSPSPPLDSFTSKLIWKKGPGGRLSIMLTVVLEYSYVSGQLYPICYCFTEGMWTTTSSWRLWMAAFMQKPFLRTLKWM